MTAGRTVTGPEKMRDGLGRMGGDPRLELPQIVGHGLALLAGVNLAHGLEIEPVPTALLVGTKNVVDGGPGQDGKLGPDGKEPMLHAQQPSRLCVRADPGDVAAEIDRQTIAQGCAGTL